MTAEERLQKALRRLEAAHKACDKAVEELAVAREGLRVAQLAVEREGRAEKVRLVEKLR